MQFDLPLIGTCIIDGAFWAGLLQIMLVNLILSGDNAVVIALAVKRLPPKQKKWGIILGSGLAVVLRIILIVFATLLLNVPFLKFVGGVLIMWIAVKLLTEGAKEEENVKEAASLKEAIKIILIADLVMSLDNVLAIAGCAKGDWFLIVIGLATSIPLVVAGAAILSALMDKYPIIVYIGAAVLGKVAGELIITDPVVHNLLHPSKTLEYIVMAVFAVGVIVIGKMLLKRHAKKNNRELVGEGEESILVKQEVD